MEKYVQYRNKLNHLIMVCKADYYINIINSNIKNSKVAWNVINQLLGKKNIKSTLASNLDSYKINEFFVTLRQNAIEDLPPKTSNNIIIIKTYKNSFALLNTNRNEVISTPKSLVSKKSAGLDGKFTIMLKYFIEVIAMPLTNIINKSLHYGIVLAALKMTRVIQIF